MIFSGWKRIWKQEKINAWSNLIILKSKSIIFEHILKKSTHSYLGAWSYLVVHVWFTLSEGPKGFVNWYFEKSHHESWTMEKRPSSMGQLHGPWCKLALNYRSNWLGFRNNGFKLKTSRKNMDQFRGNLHNIKEKLKDVSMEWLIFVTIGFWPIMLKNLPGHQVLALILSGILIWNRWEWLQESQWGSTLMVNDSFFFFFFLFCCWLF